MANDHISTDTCDTCGQKGPVRVFHHRGEPVLTQCRHCDPNNFENQARQDIDEWLAGK